MQDVDYKTLKQRLLDDGQLEFVGRTGSEVKIRGWRVDPTDLAEVILQRCEPIRVEFRDQCKDSLPAQRVVFHGNDALERTLYVIGRDQIERARNRAADRRCRLVFRVL